MGPKFLCIWSVCATRLAAYLLTSVIDMDRAVAAALLMERTVREIYEERASSAVQPLQWSILRYLQSAPSNDARVATIAKYLGTHHATVSRAVMTLFKRGYIARLGGTDAPRTSPLVLTDLGRRALQEDPILKIAEKIDSLPEGERRQFERVLTQLALNNNFEQA